MLYSYRWKCVYKSTKNCKLTQNNCYKLLEQRPVKLNYHCSHAYTYTNTQLSLICPLDFCTMSYKLSSSHWIFFVIIFHNVLSWLHVMLLHQGCLTEWTTKKEAVTEREKDRARWEGVVTASFSTESLGITCIFIRLISIWAVRETVAMLKKKKEKPTYTYTAELVKYASCSVVELWKGWMSYLIENQEKCRSRRREKRQRGREQRRQKN